MGWRIFALLEESDGWTLGRVLKDFDLAVEVEAESIQGRRKWKDKDRQA